MAEKVGVEALAARGWKARKSTSVTQTKEILRIDMQNSP
jgi:hypothetical protein